MNNEENSGKEFDKAAFLKEERDKALVKLASFNQNYQNPYPSPFLNLSDMQLPKSTIETFKWCKYYYTFDPIIAGAINALANFPVTEVMFEDDNNTKKSKEDIKLYKKVLFKNLNLHKLLIEIGIDYFLYGNCFVMGELKGDSKENLEWKNIVRLDPSKMIIDYNPATGEKRYKWQVPNKIKQIETTKKPKEEYATIPDIIKQAVRKRKTIVLDPNQVYHFSRATDSMGNNAVWGVPIVANVLKLLMYRNILRQAQEAIAREHIVPMRIYYLDRTNTVDIMADWNQIAADLSTQIKKSIQDPNYKIVSPVPVNVINVGGEGRNLLLTPEIEQIQNEILAGMNVPREFIFGGLSYSGSSISLRILENQFATYRLLLEDFVQNFLIKGMAKARGEWLTEDDNENLVTIKFAELKMQDDVQQKQLIVQLNSAGKCSNDYMWKAFGIDPEKMKSAIEEEAINAALLQGKADRARLECELENMALQEQLELKKVEIQVKTQMRMQQLMQATQPQQPMQEGTEQPQQPEQNAQANNQPEQPQQQQQGVSDEEIEAMVEKASMQLKNSSDAEINQVLKDLPEPYKSKIIKRVAELKNSQASTDMRPMPEKKPPRRNSLK